MTQALLIGKREAFLGGGIQERGPAGCLVALKEPDLIPQSEVAGQPPEPSFLTAILPAADQRPEARREVTAGAQRRYGFRAVHTTRLSMT